MNMYNGDLYLVIFRNAKRMTNAVICLGVDLVVIPHFVSQLTSTVGLD